MLNEHRSKVTKSQLLLLRAGLKVKCVNVHAMFEYVYTVDSILSFRKKWQSRVLSNTERWFVFGFFTDVSRV